MKRPTATGSQTQDTSGLSHQCSATEPRQLDNYQPSQSSICTAQVVLNASVTHLNGDSSQRCLGFESRQPFHFPLFSHHNMFTYPGIFQAPQPVKFSSQDDLKEEKCRELLQYYMPKHARNTKIAQRLFIK